MKRMILTVGALLVLCAAGMAKDFPDQPADRKAWLVENVKTFRISLQYLGPQDPKAPRYSMVLSTTPVERLSIPVANSDVVIDEKQALKIIDWLEKDGFLANTVVDAWKEGPGYVLQVTAGGHRLQQGLPWNLDTFKRMESLALVLDGDALKAARKVIDSVAQDEQDMQAAEWEKKIKGDLDHFEMTLYYDGHPKDKAFYSMTFSTQAREYGARAPYSLDAVVTKDEALKIIAWLEKNLFFCQAQEGALARDVAHPMYMLDVRGGGLRLGEDIGWGKPLLARLDSLRGIVNADAADQLGKVMTAIKKVVDEGNATPAAEKTAGPAMDAGAKVEAPQLRIAAERAKKLRANLKDFNLLLQYRGPAPVVGSKPYCALQIFTNPAVRRKVPETLLLAQIDEETAGKIIDYLATSDALDRAFEIISTHAQEVEGPADPCYVLYVGRYQAFLVFGKELDEPLKSLRALLTGEAAKQMDVLIGRLGG